LIKTLELAVARYLIYVSLWAVYQRVNLERNDRQNVFQPLIVLAKLNIARRSMCCKVSASNEVKSHINKAEAKLKIQQLRTCCESNNINFTDLLYEAGILTKKTKSVPYVFLSKTELHEALPQTIPMLQEHLKTSFNTIEDAIKDSVAGSTFRAFHLKADDPKKGPSKIYRKIVSEIFTKKIQYFSCLQNETEYEKFIVKSSNDISKKFNACSGKADMMKFGRASKLFNLSCKAMLRYRGITKVQRDTLAKLVHVPWDTFTIQRIRNLEPPSRIKKTDTMSWIAMNDVSKYKQLQKWIRDICKEADFYPIHYELFAWNKAHPN
jgi:hypothetical protein